MSINTYLKGITDGKQNSERCWHSAANLETPVLESVLIPGSTN